MKETKGISTRLMARAHWYILSTVQNEMVVWVDMEWSKWVSETACPTSVRRWFFSSFPCVLFHMIFLISFLYNFSYFNFFLVCPVSSFPLSPAFPLHVSFHSLFLLPNLFFSYLHHLPFLSTSLFSFLLNLSFLTNLFPLYSTCLSSLPYNFFR